MGLAHPIYSFLCFGILSCIYVVFLGLYECYFLILLFTVFVYKRGLLINTVWVPTLIQSKHMITLGLLHAAKLASIWNTRSRTNKAE